jgi:hypothetical protein
MTETNETGEQILADERKVEECCGGGPKAEVEIEYEEDEDDEDEDEEEEDEEEEEEEA